MSARSAEAERLTLRRLHAEDGPAALALAEQADLAGELRLRFDRGPDFFAWPAAVLDDWTYIGAFDGDRLVGFGMVSLPRGWTGSEWGPYAFSGDLRVRPELRGRGVAARITRALRAQVPPEARFIAGVVLRGNRAGLAFVRRHTPAGFALRDLGGLVATTRLAHRAARNDEGVARLGNDDLEAVRDLLAAGPHGLLAPEPTLREARRLLEPGPPAPGLALGVRDGTRLTGLVALRDLSAVRRAVLARESAGLAVTRRAFGLAARLGGLPSLPPPGRPLRSLTVTRLLVPAARAGPEERIRVARALVRAARAEAMSRGMPLLTLGLHARDPLRAAVERGLAHRHELGMYLAVAGAPVPAEATAAAPPCLDFGLV